MLESTIRWFCFMVLSLSILFSRGILQPLQGLATLPVFQPIYFRFLSSPNHFSAKMSCCAARRGAANRRKTTEKCHDCITWEEELYWKRFQPLHFCQILRPGSDFQNQIGIPTKFARNAKTILPPQVTLRGPSGASWSATMTKKGDDLFLSDGWEEFVKAYTLQATNILIFKYDGISVFDVLIFNGENMCENESAYFVKKCGHADPFTERQRKRVASEAGIEENEDNHVHKATKQTKKDVRKKPAIESPNKLNNSQSNGASRRKKVVSRREGVSSKADRSSKANTREKTPIHNPENLCDSFAMLAELGKTIVENVTSYMEPGNTTEVTETCITESPNENVTPKVDVSFPPKGSSRRKVSGKKNLNETSLGKAAAAGTKLKKASGSGVKLQSSKKKQQSSKKKIVTYAVPLDMQPCPTSGEDIMPFDDTDRPKRNYVSEEGKVAVEIARQHMTEKSFLLVLRPTNVYRRFMVTVPPAWFKKHLPPKSQDVSLRLGDKTWMTKLGYSPIKGTGQICGGWRQFVKDNELVEFDVCVFNLESVNDSAVMLDVGIFRAGPTMATPLSQVMDDAPIVVDDTPMLIIE